MKKILTLVCMLALSASLAIAQTSGTTGGDTTTTKKAHKGGKKGHKGGKKGKKSSGDTTTSTPK
ncbi:MAG TPA: hypothetical protein VKT33_13275 [Candidatus Angelobacter sp.]|nr:hypothetical protein [Candidatus Angelobacter sp.]